ncbi:MAG: hypothetical protein ACXWJM_04850 [Ramlibacter sp.]
MRSNIVRALAALTLIALTGCASYPRYVDDNDADDAGHLMQAFGIQGQHDVIDVSALRGNTLRSEIKTFITDRSIYKRYFSPSGRVFVQDDGMVAYGFLPLPTGDSNEKGEVGTYGTSKGVIIIASGSCKTEQLLVTRKRGSSEYACWLSSCLNPAPGRNWAKWDCTIENGNTLRVGR